MFPLSDHLPRRTTPIINYLLIAANIVMFIWELSLGPDIERALFAVAFIPARFWYSPDVANIFTMFVSMFLHGGWIHLGGNMLYLWIFGDNVEDRLGHGKYLFFYFICGIAATMAHAIMNPASRIPSIGASGAIAGVLGGYIVMFPRARVTTLIPIFVFITVREIPAVVVLGFWFLFQLFIATASRGVTGVEEAGGVAYFAHIGGFVTGMILVIVMGGLRRRAQPVPYNDFWR
jgi:membrane associated rhomboid family serine protease